MRYLTHSILAAILLCGVCAADPNISVQQVPTEQYAEWLTDKETLWTKEFDNLKVFVPEQVEQMDDIKAQIMSNAHALESTTDAAVADSLKKRTNELVYSLESSIEQAYGELQEKSGPALVLNL